MGISTGIYLSKTEGPMTNGSARGFASLRTTLLTAALFVWCLLGVNVVPSSYLAAQDAPGGHFLWEFDAGG
jgi:hypothetical protein